MYERCLARAQTASNWGTSGAGNAAPENDCLDPVVNPGGSASAEGGDPAINCGGSGDGEGQQTDFSDVMGMIGAAVTGCQSDGIGPNRCEPSLGGSGGGGSIGIALGAILGMDCAANPACDPSMPY